MTYSEIIAKLKKGETLTAEELTFLENTKPVTFETVRDFLEKDEAGKKHLQSLTDTAVTKGINTFKEKTLPTLLEEEIKKKFPGETEEQKKLRQLEEMLNKSEAERKRESLKNRALSYANEKKLPTGFIDRFIDEDEDKTLANVQKFESIFNEAIKNGVEEKFKNNGRQPEGGQSNSNSDDSNLTDSEYFAKMMSKK